MKNKAVFLDRDGTINTEKDYLYLKEDFEFLPGAIEGLNILQAAGYLLIVITNQSGIARGYYTEKDFQKLNKWMLEKLHKEGIMISKVYYCPHLPSAKIGRYRCICNCRKPKLGMYEKAVRDFNLDVNKCITIGDKIRDCSICLSSKCKGFLVENNEKKRILSAVISGAYENIKYEKSLYHAALSIQESNNLEKNYFCKRVGQSIVSVDAPESCS